jgi:hypothetical protein
VDPGRRSTSAAILIASGAMALTVIGAEPPFLGRIIHDQRT